MSLGGSSLRPQMRDETGADGHELCSTSLQPTLRGGASQLRQTSSPRRAEEDALLELGVLEDALRVALDGDGEPARVEELLGGSRGEHGAVLELLGLAAQPELVMVGREMRDEEEDGEAKKSATRARARVRCGRASVMRGEAHVEGSHAVV